MGVPRLFISHIPQMHANIVLSQDITEYAPLFSEISDAYFEREMYAEAGHIYEMLGGDAGVRQSFSTLKYGAHCRHTDKQSSRFASSSCLP